MTDKRVIGIAGLSAWLMVGLPSFIYHAGAPSSDWRWIAAFLIFGAAFAVELVRPHLLLLAAESAAAISLILLSCNGYEGTLLVVAAMQLGRRLDRVRGVAWIVVQTLALSLVLATRVSPRAALALGPPYLGFQLLAFFVFHIMAAEIAARRQLAAANLELKALQQILAESSRMAERLRISHELHDALGHRLTALTLNLEALLQSTQGAIRTRVETCQSLARQLLGDVREIVADAKTREGVPVAQALRTLITGVPQPRIHLEVDAGVRIFDAEGTHILFRCVQEIMTNAARHSGAENLWIVIEQDGEGVHLRAHDDGRGSDGGSDGFGLRGMRERIEKAGGQIQFSTQPGRGFGVTAQLPVRSGAA